MGISRGMRFPAESAPVPSGARLFIFTDGVFEVRRDFTVVSDLTACVLRLSTLCETEANVMDALLAHVRELRGSIQLEDDFSIIEARLH
jgi:serine phosphatase RsbU (regulator of sigma subunit)